MNHPTTQKSFLKNKWALTAAGTTLFIGIALLLLPVVAKYYITKQVVENGADTAVIDKLRINPFTGRISLAGADITLGGNTVLSNADISFDVGMMSLLKKHAVIEKAVLNGLTLEIELYEDGRMRFGSYTTGAPSNGDRTQSKSQAKPWIAQAQTITMSNCRINFKMPDLDMILQVDEASLIKFTTAPGDKSGIFSLRGSVNGTPISLDLSTLRVEPDIIAGGRIQVDGLELNSLANLLKPYLSPFTGRASADGTAMFKLSDSGDLFADYDGMIGLDQGHIAGGSFSVQGSPVRWEKGSIHFELTEKKGIVIDVDGSLTGKELAVDIPDPVINIREPALAINGKVQVLINDEVTVDTCAGFTLEHTTFSMPPLQAEAADVNWQGQKDCITFNSGTADRELSVQVEGKLGGNQLALSLSDHLTYNQKKLTADGKSEVRLGSEVYVTYDGTIGFKKINLQMEGVNSSGESIDWQGKGGFSLGTENSMQLILDGKLDGTELEATLNEPGISLTQGSIAITTNGIVDIGQNTTVQGAASLLSNGFTIQDNSAPSPLVTLAEFTIDNAEAPGGKIISIKKAAAKGLEVGIEGSMPLKVTIPSIDLNDIRTEDLTTFKTKDILVQSPTIVALENNRKLAGLDTLKIRDIQAGLDQQVTVDRINFDELFFLGESAKKNDNICSIGGARLSKIGWNPEKGMTGESLSFSDLFCTLIRDKDGDFVFNKELAAMSIPAENAGQQKGKPEGNSPGANIRLERVTLRGESGLHFEDHTLEVPFTSDLAITTLQIKNIDSANPSQPASVNLIGSIDKRAPLEVGGTVAPFSDPPAANMKMKLKNYSLADLSAYTVQSVGVAIASGQLKLKSKVKLKENKLDMSNEIVLKKLETSTISKELAEKLDNQLPIPLDSALSVLRDHEDNITLDVPLRGPLGELNVGISDILITALSKAIVPAASGYLMYTLGPYGALAWVGMKVGEQMLEIRLPPVVFSPGKSAIADDLKDYFDRLAKILQDKPKEDFQLCPKSSAWEFTPESTRKKIKEKEFDLSNKDREKLMALGQKRAANIKEYLIRSYGIDKDRLLICITKIETAKSTKPRVDIQM